MAPTHANGERVPGAVAAVLPGGCDQPADFLTGQVFANPRLFVGSPPRQHRNALAGVGRQSKCPIPSAWPASSSFRHSAPLAGVGFSTVQKLVKYGTVGHA